MGGADEPGEAGVGRAANLDRLLPPSHVNAWSSPVAGVAWNQLCDNLLPPVGVHVSLRQKDAHGDGGCWITWGRVG